LMDQYKVTKSFTSSAVGDQNVSDIEFLPTTVWPQTAPSNLGTHLTNDVAGSWVLNFPVLGAYQIYMQATTREIDPGFLCTIHETGSAIAPHTTGHQLSLLYDANTGDAYRSAPFASGLNNPVCGSIGRMMYVYITDLAQTVHIEMNSTPLLVNRSAPGSGVGQLGFGWDLIVTLIPTVFIPAPLTSEAKREKDFEKRVDERVKLLEARLLGAKPSVFPLRAAVKPPRSLSETRKQKLALAVNGEISPTPSVVEDYKLFSDAKDSKDEKASKK